VATRSWNRVELIGNLTRDPELRYTPQGTAVATFSIATNRTFISDGERKEEADFHRIVAWSKLAELCSQLLKKGNRVFVSGRLQNRNWEGQDGVQKNTTEIVIEDMILLTSKNGFQEATEGSYTPTSQASVSPQRSAPSPTTDDLPVAQEIVPASVSAPEKTEDKKPAKPATEDPGDLDDLPF
jgi:single-strand DNA-binding protein